jgi:hypothetical protein
MSFRAAQDHNKAAGQDTTSSMALKPDGRIRRQQCGAIVVVLLLLAVVSVLVSLVVN